MMRLTAVPLAKLMLFLIVGGSCLGWPGTVAAQESTNAEVTTSVQDRLDPVTRHAVQQILDSAIRADVPPRPLVRKALEGAAKRAPGERIVGAVRALAADLTVARHALGTEADESALIAGVGALRAGVPATSLREFRAVRQPAALAWPLAVLTDLVSRGVPVDTATITILSLARNGATDAALGRFENQVLHDISAGVPPGAATVARAPAGTGSSARLSGEPPPAATSRPAPPRARPAPPRRGHP